MSTQNDNNNHNRNIRYTLQQISPLLTTTSNSRNTNTPRHVPGDDVHALPPLLRATTRVAAATVARVVLLLFLSLSTPLLPLLLRLTPLF